MNTLCYNTSLFPTPCSFRLERVFTSTERDLFQKDNSAAFFNCLREIQKEYYDYSALNITYLNKGQALIEKLFNDYLYRIRQVGDGVLDIHRELLFWETTTDSVLSLLSRNNCHHEHFIQSLQVRSRDLTLRAKTGLYDLSKLSVLMDNTELVNLLNTADNEGTFNEAFAKIHLKQCAKIKRTIGEITPYTMKIGQILNSYRVISENTRPLDFSRDCIRKFYTNHTVCWKTVYSYEEKVLKKGLRDLILRKNAESKKSQTVSMKPFEQFVAEGFNAQDVANVLRKMLKNKVGKEVAKVTMAAKDAGAIIDAHIPFTTLVKEFDVKGSKSGYYKYLEPDSLLKQEYGYITESIRNKISGD